MEMAKRPNSGGAGTAKTYEGSVWTEKSLENKQDKKFGEPFYGKNCTINLLDWCSYINFTCIY